MCSPWLQLRYNYCVRKAIIDFLFICFCFFFCLFIYFFDVSLANMKKVNKKINSKSFSTGLRTNNLVFVPGAYNSTTKTWPQGSLLLRGLCLLVGLSLLHDPYLIMLSVKQGGIKYHFSVFGMTRPGIERRSPDPLENTLTIMAMVSPAHIYERS